MTNFWRGRRAAREVADELNAHIEERAADLMEAGVSRQDAYSQARRELGNATLLTEHTRETWGWMWLDHLLQDLRYGCRSLLRNPGFTAVAILSLALGIGANTAIFGLVDVLLIKSLPVRDPNELVIPGHQTAGAPKPTIGLTYELFARFRSINRSFQDLAGFGSFTWKDKSTPGAGPSRAGQWVSGNYFDVLGVPAVLGRSITPADDSIEGVGGSHGAVAMLSYDYWRKAYQLDPAVLGKSINVNGRWLTVVGVTPPEFFGTQVGRSPDVFVPIMLQPAVLAPNNFLHDSPRGRTTWLTAIGRLKPGVNEAQAGGDLAAIFESYDAPLRAPGSVAPAVHIHFQSGARGLSSLRDQFSAALQFLMVLVAVVLLIACANVANLLLARATAREREIAVRLAIGAGRSRIIRQLMTESLLLSAIGSGIGLIFALWSSRLLVGMLPEGSTPLSLEVRPDFHVIGFCVGLAIFTTVLFGLVPAIGATRFSLNNALKQMRDLRLERIPLRKALVTVEVALAVPLVLGAGLLVGTLQKLLTVDAGFTRQNVVQIGFDTDSAAYDRTQWKTVYDQLVERVSAVPGVRAVSLVNRGLMEQGTTRSGPVHFPGYTFQAGENRQLAEAIIGPDYFAAGGIPLRAGRVFTPRDDSPARRLAVVNETFVRRYFHNQNPIGKSYGFGTDPDNIEIIGVVADAKYSDLRQEPIPMAYYSWRQMMPARLRTLIVRTQGDPQTMAPALRQAVISIHPDLIREVRTLHSQIDESLVRERILATLSGFFGLLAMLLACVGLYGVVSYGVTRRMSEIGLRVALGARARNVMWMVLAETLSMAAIGVLIGTPIALLLARFTEAFLFGLKPNDPLVLSAVLLAMIAVSALAGYLPARRAARIDPMIALRND
jgi:predicted permease